MEKRKTVNVVKSNRPDRGCLILLIPLALVCMLVMLCVGAISVALIAGVISPADVQDASFIAELGDAESARVEIGAGVGKVNLNAGEESGDLFTADLHYTGEVDFTEGGDDNARTVRLAQVNNSGNFWDFFNLFNVSINDELRWDITLSPDVPLELQIDGGVGEITLNLADLNITNLDLDVGVGSMDLSLPEPQLDSYVVQINGGVGETNITLPEGVAVRVEAVIGVGEVSIDNNALQRIDNPDDDSDTPGMDGIWETEGYSTADMHIIIQFDGGVGALNVR